MLVLGSVVGFVGGYLFLMMISFMRIRDLFLFSNKCGGGACVHDHLDLQPSEFCNHTTVMVRCFNLS